VFFAAENGYSRADWLKHTQGAFTKDGTKADKFSNCRAHVARNGCSGRAGRVCPATCEFVKGLGNGAKKATGENRKA